MLSQIAIEAETADDSRTKFRLSVDANVVADDLTVVQAHLLIGEILDRIASPRPDESEDSSNGLKRCAGLKGAGEAWRKSSANSAFLKAAPGRPFVSAHIGCKATRHLMSPQLC
jgi:hypothetical protein